MQPASRRRFLEGAGAIAGLALLGPACGEERTPGAAGQAGAGSIPRVKSRDNDIKILNFALTLEHLESDFYARVIDGGLLRGAELELIEVIRSHEQDHVRALTEAARQMGVKPASKARTRFSLRDRDQVLGLATRFENLGAAAYLGAAPGIQSTDMLATALSIHTVEARQAAALAKLTGQSPTPDGAFAKPASMPTVVSQVAQFILD